MSFEPTYESANYILLMAQRKYKRGEIFHEDGSDSDVQQSVKRSRYEGEQLLVRDYITLKMRHAKTPQQLEESLLDYYTTQKYNKYLLRQLKPTPLIITSKQKQEYKQLCEMARQGKNICVFGKGSKIALLNKIQREELPKYHAFRIKAYLPSVTEKKIYSHFGSMLVDLGYMSDLSKVTIRDMLDQYKIILAQHNKVRLVVVLHSIDGPNLLAPEHQERLAELIDIPQIQLITSLDSIGMVYNWSSITLQKFKLHFFHIDTDQPYIEELRFCQLKSESRESSEQGLLQIWQSLNKNQKQILRFIAERELMNLSLSEHQITHYTFQQLLDKCIQQIVLSSDHQLRQNLLQLHDHKVIIERTDQRKNKKIYIMKYQKRTLQKILDLKIE